MRINRYEHTHMSEMENEGIQQTFQLLSKYEKESLFSISEPFFNILNKYNEMFFLKFFNIT